MQAERKRPSSPRGEVATGKIWAHHSWFEIGVVISGVAALAVVGPFRDAFTALPEVMLVGALVVFMVPGALLARWCLSEYFSGAALLPAAFVLSAGAFALLGLPLLILQSSMGAYLWVSGAMVGASLLVAAITVLLSALRREQTAEPRSDLVVFDSGGLLWVPFVGLVAALTYISRINAPSFFGDLWIYLSWIREFLGGNALTSVEPYFGDEVGLSRARIDGWLLEQAAFSRVSGVDPVDLVISHMSPVLVVVALLGFYALARTLFESEKMALFCGCLYALFFLVHLDASRLSFGGEFVQRLVEDKLAAKFLFLPMALAFAVAFLRSGRRAYFWCFAFVCAAVMGVHPIGLAVIGLSMAGFATLHLAAKPRSCGAISRISALALAGLVIVAVPAISVPAITGEPLTAVLADSDINSGDPEVLRNMIFVQPERMRIFEFADGSYMMHPSLLLDPVILVALMLGVPFLLWRLRRSLAAQFLLGVLLVATLVCYVPPVATFIGENIVLPGQLWRLAWPIPLAALLTLGWLIWEATSHAAALLSRFRLTRLLARTAPLLLVVGLTVAASPWTMEGIELVQRHKEDARSRGLYPADPIYPWLRGELESPAVVLAKEVQGVRIPAYSSEANVVSSRGILVLQVLPALERRVPGRIEVPQGALDVQEFFRGTSITRKVEILRRHKVDYVMVQTGSRLDRTLGRLPGFKRLDEPSERYDIYHVDLRRLDRLLPRG
jgi:Family of unknown function (DUF6077)/Family of unknown function (DUF6541)